LIQRHLFSGNMQVYAAPAYVQRYGMPKDIADLENHRLVVYGEDMKGPMQDVNWLLTAGLRRGQARRPAMTVNNAYAIMRAIRSGVGIGALPEFVVQGRDDMVRVLPELEGPQLDAYFVYPEEMRKSKRLQVFRDFLFRQIAQDRL
jgi:DNA-binding transcriptional LysR family regulator